MTLALALAAAGGVLLILVLVLRKVPSFQAGIPGWAAGIVSGFLLGIGIGFVAMHQFGYKWERQLRPGGDSPISLVPETSGTAAPPRGSGSGAGGMGGGMMGGGGGPGGGGGGPGSGGGGPGGGGGGPGSGGGGPSGGGPSGGGPGGGGPGGGGGRRTPQTTLSNLVQKVNLVTSGISVELAPDQAKQISKALEEIAQFQALTDEDAQKMLDAIQGALTDEQIKVLDSIGLPQRRGGGGAGGGGALGPPPETYTNPFGKEGEAKTSLQQLRERLQQHVQ